MLRSIIYLANIYLVLEILKYFNFICICIFMEYYNFILNKILIKKIGARTDIYYLYKLYSNIEIGSTID